MSAPLVHAAAAVAASPLPSPQVIKETFTNTIKVPVGTPPVVVQAVMLGLTFAASFVLSVGHQIVEWFAAYRRGHQNGWPGWFNRLLATVYSVGAGVAAAASTGHLGTNLPDLLTTGILSAFGLAGSFWTYEVRQLVAGLFGGSAKPVSLPVVPLEDGSQSAASEG